jgi:hypothetical protein
LTTCVIGPLGFGFVVGSVTGSLGCVGAVGVGVVGCTGWLGCVGFTGFDSDDTLLPGFFIVVVCAEDCCLDDLVCVVGVYVEVSDCFNEDVVLDGLLFVCGGTVVVR